MKISIACDHGGYELKLFIIKWLKENNHSIIDLGNEVYNINDDYPDFSEKIARHVVSGNSDKGIVICGSGVGACIAANKIKGARASVCHDTYSARQGVEHDNMNILCLGARIIGVELAKELVVAFLNATFINEFRYNKRLEKINILENKK
ncbi:MAG: ribose 5-phosphate isomerase B [Ignavibacteriaceae bacterium]|nr:ribose 5-phosphate isomerase B [Ignavibacteriaceae bacterium]